MFNKIHIQKNLVLFSYFLICAFTGAEAFLPYDTLTLDGTMGRFLPATSIPGFCQGLPSLLPSASSCRMCSKAAFAVCSGAQPAAGAWPCPAQLPWEARQEQHPGSLSNCPLRSLAHTAMGCNSSFQQGKYVPALQGKILKGSRHKWSKILQRHFTASLHNFIQGCFSTWIGNKKKSGEGLWLGAATGKERPWKGKRADKGRQER